MTVELGLDYAAETSEKRFPGLDAKLYLVVRILFWSSKEFGVFIYCHYSQVHSKLKC